MKKTTLSLGAAVLAAGLALTGCGSNDDDQQDTDTTQSPAEDAGAEETGDDSDASLGGGDSAAGVSNLDAAKAAIKTAEDKAGTATGIDFDEDEDQWEVKTVEGGDKYEFDISADGKEIVKEKKERADKDDQEEVSAAKITLTEAIEKVSEEFGGELDEADLDRDKNVYQYEVTLKTDGNGTDYYVHAESGEVSVSKHS